MNFGEQICHYMETLAVSGKELAERSGLSQAVISRYRNGERIPAADSEQLQSLIQVLAEIAEEKGNMELTAQKIRDSFLSGMIQESAIDISERLDELIQALKLNVAKMAASIHYDASFLSKIRQGKRKPADPDQFCSDISGYIARHFVDERSLQVLAELVSADYESCAQEEERIARLMAWFQAEEHRNVDYVSGFLEKMDEFDLEQYISAIHFDQLKVPKVPFQLPASKHYYGLAEMREGELDFLKAAVLSKSMEPLYLCADMPVKDMAEDVEFAKKYMFGLAMVLKKGLQIHMIHNVERPMADLMLGLENWIPLYMTGQIVPRYLKGVQNQIYQHLHYCAGTTAMRGECIAGHHESGTYYLTNNKTEVQWMKKYMKQLYQKTYALMDIYREDRKEKLEQFLEADSHTIGLRRRILSQPPIAVMSEDRFGAFLEKKGLSEQKQRVLLDDFKKMKIRFEAILEHSPVEDVVTLLSPEEYEKRPVRLSLSGGFLGEDLWLSYEEYEASLLLAEEYAKAHERYHFVTERKKGYRNIQISLHKGKWCMVSKGKAPEIHFVIRHPKLLNAFENLFLPVVEGETLQDS